MADPGVPPVDLADEPLDLVPFVLVVLDRFAGRRRDLHHHAALGVERAVVEQRPERLHAQADALGVVEAVDAEQDHLGVAEARAQRRRRPAHGALGGQVVELLDVDRDREHPDVRGRVARRG